MIEISGKKNCKECGATQKYKYKEGEPLPECKLCGEPLVKEGDGGVYA